MEGFFLLPEQRLVQRRGLLRVAAVVLLGAVRCSGGLALFGLAAPSIHILGNMLVCGEVAGRLAAWLHGPSLQPAAFQLRNRNKLLLIQLSDYSLFLHKYVCDASTKEVSVPPQEVFCNDFKHIAEQMSEL